MTYLKWSQFVVVVIEMPIMKICRNFVFLFLYWKKNTFVKAITQFVFVCVKNFNLILHVFSPSSQNNHKVIYSGYYHQNASENKILLCDKHSVFNALIACCWSYGAKSAQNKAQHMIYQFDLKIHMYNSLGIFQKLYVHHEFYFSNTKKFSFNFEEKGPISGMKNIEMWKWLKH